METSINVSVDSWDTARRVNEKRDVIMEEPLSIRVQGNPYAVVMRTPGNEIAHVAGFCLAEGIVDREGGLRYQEIRILR